MKLLSGANECTAVNSRTGAPRRYLALLLSGVLLTGCGSNDRVAKEASPASDSIASKSKPAPGSGEPKRAANATEPAQLPAPSPDPEPPAAAERGPAEPFDPLELVTSLEADFVNIETIAMAPDNRTFVTGGGTPKIWEMGTDEPLFAFEDLYPLTGTIVEAEAIAISSDGKLLAIGGGDGLTHLFDLATREPRHTIKSHENGVVSVSFSKDGQKLATSSYDGKAKLWNTESGEQIATCNVQEDLRVRSVILPDGKTLVSAGNEAQLWSAESGEKLGDLDRGEPRDIGVWSVDVSADGSQIVTGDATVDFENAAMVWSVETREITATLKHDYGVWSVAFSPDGKLLATADFNGVARIWRLADQQLVQTIENEEVNSIEAIAWTPDGKTLAVASDGTIRFWRQAGATEVSRNSSEQDTVPMTELGEPESAGAESELEADTDEVLNREFRAELPLPPAEAFDEVVPLTVGEAAALFDPTEFPAPGDAAPQIGSKPTSVTFHIEGEFAHIVAESVDTMDSLGWELVARSEPIEDNAAFYLRHQGLLLACKLRLERNSLVRMDVEVVGNVDIRSIPKTKAEEALYDFLDYVVYQTSADLDEIMAFYDAVLTEAGWLRYDQFDGYGFDNPERRFARYRNRGVALNVSADVSEGRTLASLFCSMLDQDVPTPASATDLQLDDHLCRQRFRSTQGVSELAQFFVNEMQKIGWSMPFGKQLEESKAGMLFTRPRGEPVYLELLARPDGTTIAYMARPTRQVTYAVEQDFEIEYDKSLPLKETVMHSVPYQSIPFHQPLEQGSGRTVAESVFFNTKATLEEIFDFYRSHFGATGWEPGDRNDEFIGDNLQRATVTFSQSDAEITVTAGPWVEGTNRVNIEGSGIEWPGGAFCHMMARADEAADIEPGGQ